MKMPIQESTIGEDSIVSVTFQMNTVYWSWLVNEWSVVRKDRLPGFTFSDFVGSIMNDYAKHTIGNINRRGKSMSIKQARALMSRQA